MKESGKDMVLQIRNRWLLRQVLEIFLYACGPGILVFLLAGWITALLTFISLALLLFLFFKPWNYTPEKICSLLDSRLPDAEYSSGLLLASEKALSGIARLQQRKVLSQLGNWNGSLRGRLHLLRSGLLAVLFLALGVFLKKYQLWDSGPDRKLRPAETIIFQPVDSIPPEKVVPYADRQQLTVNFPEYTRRKTLRTSTMNVKAVEGSGLAWKIHFNIPVREVAIVINGTQNKMKETEGSYSVSTTLNHSGFYNFLFLDTQGNAYVSELYSLEALTDEPPGITLKGLDQFKSFDHDESKIVSFATRITDDFGIREAHIIATVSKGSGESVKFREERLAFDTPVIAGRQTLELTKKLDLDSLNMDPGDELYFYVEATDVKLPKANTTHSETYFAVIRDTLTDQFGVEGTMAADLMPDYFRSQRQLIIDTEKLIRDRPEMGRSAFNTTSNELGFDQKSLRLKYGAFMGEEDADVPSPAAGDTDEGSGAGEGLAHYTHNHDSEHDPPPVEESQENDKAPNTKNPLEAYLHDDADPKTSAKVELSLRSKLLQAMDEMWDAELYLRLYQPEESLPFQYRSLKLLQEIKNTARIYVHRIGFDPPPIKEDTRLSGKLEDVKNYRDRKDSATDDPYTFIRQALGQLEAVRTGSAEINNESRHIFEKAGRELAAEALKEPGKYLKTLQGLAWLSGDIQQPPEVIAAVQKGLLKVLPAPVPDPKKRTGFYGELDELIIKEMEKYDP